MRRLRKDLPYTFRRLGSAWGGGGNCRPSWDAGDLHGGSRDIRSESHGVVGVAKHGGFLGGSPCPWEDNEGLFPQVIGGSEFSSRSPRNEQREKSISYPQPKNTNQTNSNPLAAKISIRRFYRKNLRGPSPASLASPLGHRLASAVQNARAPGPSFQEISGTVSFPVNAVRRIPDRRLPIARNPPRTS